MTSLLLLCDQNCDTIQCVGDAESGFVPSWREEATEREAARRRAIEEEEVQIRPQASNRQNEVANELGLGGGDQRQPAGRTPFRIRDDEERMCNNEKYLG